MRRFLILVLLLVLTLLVGHWMDADGACLGSGFLDSTDLAMDGPFEASLHLNLDVSERDLFEPERASRSHRRVRSQTYPRARDGEVRFRLRDRGYERVSISGSFDDWREEPMRYDETHDVWEIRLDLGRGVHRYAFVVADERGERLRTDPSNPRRSKRPDGRWVSEIVVGRDGRIDEPYREEVDFDLVHDVGLSYQRVDGWSVWTRPRFTSSEPFSPMLRAHLGYGFKSSRWSLQAVLLQPLTWDDRLRLVLTAYDKTDFTIQTGVGTGENTLSSWIFAEDNRDYYRREGVGFGLAFGLGDEARATVMFRSDDYGTLENRARGNWGWGRDSFLPNPAIDEGTLRSLVAAVRLGSRLRHVAVDYEISDDGLASTAFRFSQLTGQVRTRLRLGRAQYVDLRLKAGTNFSGTLPVQKRYVLGGIGTVRGYSYQSLLVPDPSIPRGPDDPAPFGGQRMALLNAEYAFGVDEDVLLVLFFDSGMAFESRDADMGFDAWKSSAGFGIQLGSDDPLRFDFAKPLESSGSDVVFQVRLNRMF
jgi:hypothetical protein